MKEKWLKRKLQKLVKDYFNENMDLISFRQNFEEIGNVYTLRLRHKKEGYHVEQNINLDKKGFDMFYEPKPKKQYPTQKAI